MKILISDFDNTFFNKDYLENIDLINKFVDDGNMFIIATGRSINNLKQDIQDYRIKYSYLICSDGASIYDHKYNNLYSCDIDSALINPICELLDNDSNISITLIENDNIVSGTKANTIAAKFENKNLAQDLVKKIDEKFDGVYAYLSENYINIRNKKVSKSEAIKFLINNYNLDESSIYTIGDSVNDIEMCKNFNSFSFYDAYEELKEVSNTLVKDFKMAMKLL